MNLKELIQDDLDCLLSSFNVDILKNKEGKTLIELSNQIMVDRINEYEKRNSMKKKYIYYDRENYCFKEIGEEYLESADKFVSYFRYIDDCLDNNREIIIYELVPHKVFKKEVDYKFK